MDDKGRDPQQGRRHVHPDPPFAPLRVNRDLQQVTGGRHRQEERGQAESGRAVDAAVRQLDHDVAAPDQPDGKQQQWRRQDVEMLDEGLPRVIHHRPFIGRLDQIPHPGVGKPGSRYDEVCDLQEDHLGPRHGMLSAEVTR